MNMPRSFGEIADNILPVLAVGESKDMVVVVQPPSS